MIEETKENYKYLDIIYQLIDIGRIERDILKYCATYNPPFKEAIPLLNYFNLDYEKYKAISNYEIKNILEQNLRELKEKTIKESLSYMNIKI